MVSATQIPNPAGLTGSRYGQRLGAALKDFDSSSNPWGVKLVSFYVFLVVSRVLDVSSISQLHIPLILLLVLIALTLASGGFSYAFSSKMTRVYGLFTLWVAVCLPFSLWRSVSKGIVQQSMVFFLIYLIIVQSVRTTADWRKVAGGYAYAVFAASLLATYFSRGDVGGRLAVAGGTLGDPNEFALTVLSGLPFLWLKAKNANVFGKFFFWGCLAISFFAFAKSGSRGGLLALLAMLVITFFLSNGSQKMLLCVAACVGVAASAMFLPDYLKVRYFTLFTPGSSNISAHTQQSLVGDIASSEERRALLLQSIHMTFTHPIFGVGPGVFPDAAFDERRAETGVGGINLVTHNTYTQISSETGFPGLFLFMASLILAVKWTLSDYRASRRANPNSGELGKYFLIPLGSFAVGMFFLSVGYSYFLTIFFALGASLHNVMVDRAAENEREMSAAKIPANQIMANQVGANQVGANQVGANQVGANQLPANRLLAKLGVLASGAQAHTPGSRRTPSYQRKRGLQKAVDSPVASTGISASASEREDGLQS